MLRQSHSGKQFINFLLVMTLCSPLNQIAGKMRRKGGNKIEHIAAQEGSFTEANFGHAGRK